MEIKSNDFVRVERYLMEFLKNCVAMLNLFLVLSPFLDDLSLDKP